MKNHISSTYNAFKDGCDRADKLKSIFKYLKKVAPAALNCDDILRSALVLAVSSFDLFIHDLFRLKSPIDWARSEKSIHYVFHLTFWSVVIRHK